MKITGRVWTLGDDVNTDVIHPPSFYSLDPEIVKKGLLHGYDPTIQPRLQPGDVFVGGTNFGCGSSRETSIRSLLLNQIGAVIAVDFARIFFRNATNNALPCFAWADPRHSSILRAGQHIEIDVETARITTDGGEVLELLPPGAFIRAIWRAGGLLSLLDEERARAVRVPASGG